MTINRIILTSDLRDGVWYINYAVCACSTEEERKQAAATVQRWAAHQTKNAAGKDAFGRYYTNKKHTVDTIRAFKMREKERHGGSASRTSTTR